MSKVNCWECQFYNAGRCEELGEYTTPGECECSWFAQKINKKPCFAKCEKSAKQTVFHRITASPEVLAPYFIDIKSDDYGTFLFYSKITKTLYSSEEVAFEATVKKLKEFVE